jgi:cupin fold WbuC family metalloprotein
MLIVMHRSSYVAPHCHLGKSESLALIEGSCDVFLFDEGGKVLRTVSMAADPQAGCFLYRMPQALFHTLRFKTEWTEFIESTIGPFDRLDTNVATWAPPGTDPDSGLRYLHGLTTSRA